jgi:hypothetical protein
LLDLHAQARLASELLRQLVAAAQAISGKLTSGDERQQQVSENLLCLVVISGRSSSFSSTE